MIPIPQASAEPTQPLPVVPTPTLDLSPERNALCSLDSYVVSGLIVTTGKSCCKRSYTVLVNKMLLICSPNVNSSGR